MVEELNAFKTSDSYIEGNVSPIETFSLRTYHFVDAK
jgi:hypothetical protein